MQTQLKFESKEQARDFIHAYVKIGDVLPDEVINNLINHYMTCVSLYRMKLTDIIWFEGIVGEDGVVNITINPDITSEEISKRVEPYIGKTRSYLVALCKKKEGVPDWVMGKSVENDISE